MYFLFCFIVVFILRIQTNVAEPCQEEGAEWLTPSNVLKCIKGSWIAVGCFDDDGKRLKDGEVIRTESYLIQCQKVDQESMKMATIACVQNGRMLVPTQTIITSTAYYTCTPTKNGLILDSGCVYENNTYAIGETMDNNALWYVCQKSNDKTEFRAKGCMQRGLRMNVGELFHDNGFLYKCIDEDEVITKKGVGCLEVTNKKTIVEHAIGEKWMEGNHKLNYYVQCTDDGHGLRKMKLTQ